ncbi:hypothetical protein QF019_002225 [Pseudomonas frederiksbergensis]
MFKVTPNPPDTDPVPYDASFDLDPKKMKAATDRALDFYLNPRGDENADTAPHIRHLPHHRRSGG